MKKNTWASNKLFFLVLFLCLLTEVLPRPGMGGSYRSSSSNSSSSSYRSSSYNSSSSSSKSRTNSGSGYTTQTNSDPEPTAYFVSESHEIYIHFRTDGSAHVKEKMVVIQNSAKVGIVRNKFPILFDWEIENLKVTPEIYSIQSLPYQIYINWQEGTNNQNLPIEIEYDIKNGIDSLGNLPLTYWSIPKNSKDNSKGKFEITWDPGLHWKSFEVKQKFYDPSISDYAYEEITKHNLENGYSLDYQTIRDDMREIIITGYPADFAQVTKPGEEILSGNKYYHLKQTTKIHYNTSNEYSGIILFPDDKVDSPSTPYLNFDYSYFLDNKDQSFLSFLSPTYQFVYALSRNLSSSFWSLHHAEIDKISERRRMEGTEFESFEVGYSRLGENRKSKNGQKEIIQITPFAMRYKEFTLGSFAIELQFPKDLDLKNTDVKMYISDCSYCLSNNLTLSLPIEIGKDQNRIYLNWENPLPTGYHPVIQIETDGSNFSRNYIYTYISALRAFFLAPGSGTNIGYLAINSFLFLSPLFIGFIFYFRKLGTIQKEKKAKTLLLEIQTHDPNFDMSEFLKKTQFISERIVEAWCAGDMNPARHFISAGVFQRFQIQLKLLKEIDSIVNIMKDFQVLAQDILLVTKTKEYLSIHAKIKCEAKDINVPVSFTKHQIDAAINNSSRGVYEEVYSFSRKISTHSVIGKDLIHNLCPSCGASSPFSHNTNKCEYCGSIFNSGEADWVLSEITQLVEWDKSRFKSAISNENSTTFPHTSSQIIEDRASALLWKWIYAKTKGNADTIKRETLSETILKRVQTKDTFYMPAVGSAEIKDIQKLGSEYLADIELRWSFARSLKALAENKKTLIRLRLKENRDSKIGFGEVTCKNCGSPFPELDSAVCSYCGEPIPSLISDWLLESID